MPTPQTDALLGGANCIRSRTAVVSQAGFKSAIHWIVEGKKLQCYLFGTHEIRDGSPKKIGTRTLLAKRHAWPTLSTQGPNWAQNPQKSATLRTPAFCRKPAGSLRAEGNLQETRHLDAHLESTSRLHLRRPELEHVEWRYANKALTHMTKAPTSKQLPFVANSKW